MTFAVDWACTPLTSRQKTNRSAHLDKRSKLHHQFEMAVRSARPKSALPLFSKTTQPRALLVLAHMSKEACSYAGVNWLSSSVSQMMAIDKYLELTYFIAENMRGTWTVWTTCGSSAGTTRNSWLFFQHPLNRWGSKRTLCVDLRVRSGALGVFQLSRSCLYDSADTEQTFQ